MKTLYKILLCVALLPILNASGMRPSSENNNNAPASPRFPVRESRALLDVRTREHALRALEGSPKSPRNAALAILEEVRSTRTLLPARNEYENPRTVLLMAEKNISHQLELLTEQKDNQKVLTQLNDLMTEARIAIIQAQTALEDNQAPVDNYHTGGNYSPRASGQDIESVLANVDRIVEDYYTNRSELVLVPHQSDAISFNEATSDIEESTARTNRTLATVRQSLDAIKRRHAAEHTVTSEMSEKVQLGRILEERLALSGPIKAYDTCLAFFREYPTFVVGRSENTNYPLLHEGLNRLCTEASAGDYILFASLLECGADRTVLNARGQTLLEVALESNNEMLIQLLTLEMVTKDKLFTLALEHDKVDLMPYFLE